MFKFGEGARTGVSIGFFSSINEQLKISRESLFYRCSFGFRLNIRRKVNEYVTWHLIIIIYPVNAICDAVGTIGLHLEIGVHDDMKSRTVQWLARSFCIEGVEFVLSLLYDVKMT